MDLEQAIDVGCGVVELGLSERSVEPVGEPVRLRQLHAELALVQRGEGGRRHPEEAGRDLCVEEPLRHGARGELEYFEVLRGRMEDGEGIALHDRSQR